MNLRKIPLKKESDCECKGVVFRATVNIFSTENYIREVRQLKILKLKSCPGCEKCGWIMEYIGEDINGGEFDRYLTDIQDGKMYTAHINASQEWESGVWEIDDIDFIEYKG